MPDPVIPVGGTEDTKIADGIAAEGLAAEEYDSAFSEAAAVPDQAELIPADDPKNFKEEDTVVTPVTPTPEVTPVSEVIPVTPVTSSTPDPTLQQPGESDEKYEQRYKTLQGIFTHDKETWKQREADLLAQIEAAKAPPAAPTPPADLKKTDSAAAFIDSLTDEQKAQLAEYEQDFDVVSKMEGLKRSQELGKLRAEVETWKADILSQLTAQATQFSTQVAPALALAEENELNTHFNVIKGGYVLDDGTTVPGHSDFEKFRDDGSLKAWIESKPRYLQPALMQTYSQGSAMDVIDLISDFKRDNNIPLTPNTPENVLTMTPARASRKAALTAVTTKRGAVNISSAQATDYDSAFDEAVNKH